MENEIDASFFSLIHQLAGSPRPDDAAERRKDRRKPFVSTQRIAARRGTEVPDESEFIEIQCHDLTRHGFSFFLPNHPEFDSLVAAFGTPPEVLYVAAEVSHCEDVLLHSTGLVQSLGDRAAHVSYEDHTGRTAQTKVLVGCRFTERLA